MYGIDERKKNTLNLHDEIAHFLPYKRVYLLFSISSSFFFFLQYPMRLVHVHRFLFFFLRQHNHHGVIRFSSAFFLFHFSPIGTVGFVSTHRMYRQSWMRWGGNKRNKISSLSLYLCTEATDAIFQFFSRHGLEVRFQEKKIRIAIARFNFVFIYTGEGAVLKKEVLDF